MQWKRGDFSLTDELSGLDLKATVALIQGTYWGATRRHATIERSLIHSLNFGLYQDGKQIGFARVVTDRATVGYLCDVVIAAEHRGQGIGKWMLQCILDHPVLAECRIDLFTRDAQDFYRSFGFGPHKYTSMVRYLPE